MNTDQEFDIFCKNVRFLRQKSGLSQKEMAAIMRIGVKSLRKIENGVFPPRLGIDAMFYLSRHFHLKIRQLFYEMQ